MLKSLILNSTGATDLKEVEQIQELWSGYGAIKRFELRGSDIKSVVVKHVDIPSQASHPRGWNSNISHQRKIKSYKIEMAWYRDWSRHLDKRCKVPECFGLESSKSDDFFLLILEDLDSAGFSKRKSSATIEEMKICLKWLARFHATFLGKTPDKLWETGTYWHLDTRPDELNALKDKDLKNAAKAIDQKLSDCPFKTFVHGDAKLANFCFSNDSKKVAAVDFQYVGGGCGMKDVAYFIGSCLDEKDCDKHEEELLSYYFDVFGNIVREKNKNFDANQVVDTWRELFSFAWADFHRFIKGWSPGHWKINSYSETITRKAIDNLD